MGYFSNGTEGDMYEQRYCERCRHYDGCPVWAAHFLYNYDQNGIKDSILDMLIPRSKDGLGNEQCKMFIPTENV